MPKGGAVMSRNFHSMFADDIRGMVEHKKALGHKAESYEWNMQNFDRYCMKFFPEVDVLAEEIVLGWCEAGKEFRKSAYRANAIREFGRYLSSIGKSAYVLPREFFPPKRAELPHLFTDDELVRFFDAADHFPHYARSPLAEYIVPVIFRLQYACGLRPQEARLLRRADFDFRRNTIYVSESKWCRDRCLSINPELMQLCRRYDVIAQGLVPDRAYFFPSPSGNAYSHGWLTAVFHKCWAMSGNAIPTGICTPYTFRHNFATRTLMRWAEEGKDFWAYLPYLSAYMGHASFHSSYYYVHLLPEKLGNAGFMDTHGIIPEVAYEE